MAPEVQLEIVGLLKETAFQIAKCIAESLKGESWEYSSNLMCFVNGQLIGNEKDLKVWAEEHWDFIFFRPPALYSALAENFYSSHLGNTKHTFVYMDISIGGNAIGRLLFELFSDLCPKTSRNFQQLCTGEAGSTAGNLQLTYKGSIFHRVIPNGWIQGGDISGGKGVGGESIYGPTFEDESFAVPHNKRGILGMANKRRHTNGSQFYIVLKPAPWMDTKYVAFGQLIEGTEVLKKLEAVPTYNERPKHECKVMDCGIYVP